MTELAAAALDLLREIDINRLVVEAHRDTEVDHRALNEARQRYDRVRGSSWKS